MLTSKIQRYRNLLPHMMYRDRCRADRWGRSSPGCLDFSAASEHREQGWKADEDRFPKFVMQSGIFSIEFRKAAYTGQIIDPALLPI